MMYEQQERYKAALVSFCDPDKECKNRVTMETAATAFLLHQKAEGEIVIDDGGCARLKVFLRAGSGGRGFNALNNLLAVQLEPYGFQKTTEMLYRNEDTEKPLCVLELTLDTYSIWENEEEDTDEGVTPYDRIHGSAQLRFEREIQGRTVLYVIDMDDA